MNIIKLILALGLLSLMFVAGCPADGVDKSDDDAVGSAPKMDGGDGGDGGGEDAGGE